MNNSMCNAILYFKKIVLIVLRILIPIISNVFNVRNNRILIDSFMGKQYSCNPKYISEYLVNNGKYNFDLIWVLNSQENGVVPKKIKVVKYLSLQYFYYFFTSQIIINNCGRKSYLGNKKNQKTIETWHGGGAYKKTDLDVFSNIYLDYAICTTGGDKDYYISSCSAFSEVMSHAQAVDVNNFLPIGMPRNDIFFNKEKVEEISLMIREKYKLGKKKVILYAPTWRDDGRTQDINNLILLVKNLNNFNRDEEQYVLLCRSHHAGSLKDNVIYDNLIINVSSYPDMQELLCAADILITDYSSCMWDFSLMYKPCFIYATDIDKYRGERDFYTPMSEWPFPIAANIEELLDNMKNFNEKEYIEKVKQHHKALGSYEDGHATEKVCKLIEEICFGKEQ